MKSLCRSILLKAIKQIQANVRADQPFVYEGLFYWADVSRYYHFNVGSAVQVWTRRGVSENKTILPNWKRDNKANRNNAMAQS
jgi:hypothetical protein